MKLGIDWDGTMASYPEAFRRLVKYASEVYIITLNPYVDLESIRLGMDLEKEFNPNVKLRLHIYPYETLRHNERESQRHAPEWKATVCNELDIDIFFDDRKDVCDMVENTSCAAVMHLTHRDNIL